MSDEQRYFLASVEDDIDNMDDAMTKHQILVILAEELGYKLQAKVLDPLFP